VLPAVKNPAQDSGPQPVHMKSLDCRLICGVDVACLITHSAQNKSVSLQELNGSNDIDVFGVTEMWHVCSDNVTLHPNIPPVTSISTSTMRLTACLAAWRRRAVIRLATVVRQWSDTLPRHHSAQWLLLTYRRSLICGSLVRF